MTDFQVSVQYDGAQGIAQAAQLGKAIEEAGVKGDQAGARIAAALDEATAATIREMQAIRQHVSVLSEDVQMRQREAAALRETVEAQRRAREAANAATRERQQQMALGQSIADSIERERRMVILHSQALEENARRTAAIGGAARQAAVGITSLREPLTSAARTMLNLNPVAAQLSSVLGAFAIGAAPMVAILAGAAALGFAWQQLTKDARAAKEEHERLMKILDEAGKQRRLGVFGDFGPAAKQALADVKRITDEIEKLRKQRSDLEGLGTAGGLARATAGSKIADLAKQEDAALVRLGDAYLQLNKIRKEEADKAIEAEKRKLDAIKAANQEYFRQAEALAQLAFVADQMNAIIARGVPGLRDPLRSNFTAANLPTPTAAALPDASAKVLRDTQATARAIEEAVRGASQLAEAFGLVDRNIAQIVQGIGQAVAGIGPLREALNRRNTGQGGTLDVIGAALPVVGGIASVISGIKAAADAQRQAAEDIRKANADFVASLRQFSTSFVEQWQQLQDRTKAISDAVWAEIPEVVRNATRGGQPANLGLTPEALEAKRLEEERIRQSYRDSLTQQYNATRGPLGESQNALDELMKWYRDQLDTIAKLNLGYEERAKVEEIFIARNKDIVETYRKAIDVMAPIIQAAKDLNANALSSRAGSLYGGNTFNRLATYTYVDDKGNTTTVAPTQQERAFEQYLDSIDQMNRAAQQEVRIAEEMKQYAAMSLQVQREQLSATQSMVDDLRSTVEALRGAQDRLRLSATSPLNPEQRYAEAERQFEALVTKAFGGDQDAARTIAQGGYEQFLNESVAMYGKTAAQVADYQRVQSVLGGLEGLFGPQLSEQERILAELQRQTAIQEQQYGLQQSSARQQLIDSQIERLKSQVQFGGPGSAQAFTDLQWMLQLMPGLTLEEIYAARRMALETGNRVTGNTPEEQLANDPTLYGTRSIGGSSASLSAVVVELRVQTSTLSEKLDRIGRQDSDGYTALVEGLAVLDERIAALESGQRLARSAPKSLRGTVAQ